ncbi:MAG TPA: SDR family oxidoreductase [Balneolaceae bacterium]|nr:SDR family oxidoreductase [Balneolaceae bacterium]
MTKILVAGASGYLGKHILEELENWGISSIALVRSVQKLDGIRPETTEVVEAEVTKPETLRRICEGVDVVISTVGITRQQDGLTYNEVDFQANMNLLTEAKSAGVRKFIYISVINGKRMRHLKMVDAKERFADELVASGLEYTIIRPNGFYPDLKELLPMAKNGKVYLFGHGEYKLNPIHGADLAEVCVRAIAQKEREIIVGGPDILTQNEIVELALRACNKPINIGHVPDWIRVLILKVVQRLLPGHYAGPLEFFLTFIAMDHIATRYGTRRLQDFFNEEVHKH